MCVRACACVNPMSLMELSGTRRVEVRQHASDVVGVYPTPSACSLFRPLSLLISLFSAPPRFPPPPLALVSPSLRRHWIRAELGRREKTKP